MKKRDLDNFIPQGVYKEDMEAYINDLTNTDPNAKLLRDMFGVSEEDIKSGKRKITFDLPSRAVHQVKREDK